ncbi:MAG: pilus (MSHA type) biogenesis protein MshL [Woeseiaceae bacterium]|nr:pilus (MSHA type) biogenesis protein MshL [Woeseiaceae bacterium]
MLRRHRSFRKSPMLPAPRVLATGVLCTLVAACAAPGTPVDFSAGHIVEEPVYEAPPEPFVPPAPVIPEPEPVPIETYTVVVKDVPVDDLLFSLARDAGLDLDMQTSPEKTVTLNAVERPLQEILVRISEQAELRYQLNGTNLIVMDDMPYWHNYVVDYVNIARTSESEVGVATQIATSGGSVSEDMTGSSGGAQQNAQGNKSITTVRNNSQNDFWSSIELGLSALVADEDAMGDSIEASNSVIVNRTSGIVTVRGTQSEHRRVQDYLDRIMASSRRQVLIEMTIVEVELNDSFQAGVDWQRLAAVAGDGWSVESNMTSPDLNVSPFFALSYADTDSSGDSIAATVRMLQEFGDTQVLSSPKIMALNNQTALLKVVNERVYFNVELDIREATADIPERRTFTSEINTVPVGLVMSVTPQVSDNGFVSLNIRPTISRITGFAIDPAPRLAGADFDNLVPEIQVREIESLLQVLDGRTVVLGGLMQNERNSEQDGVPGLSRIPGVGRLFSYTSDELVKTELVIFLRPTIVANGTAPAGSARLGDYYQVPEPGQVTTPVRYR